MITAQYVIACHVTERPLPPPRQAALLRQFAASRLTGGLWGLYVETEGGGHAEARPSLFVTVLVYVAARLLGVNREAALLQPTHGFLDGAGGALAIPTWGKFWLALLNLYDWRGLQPILPETWLLPKRLMLHPANFYCHTRLIYLAMAYVFGRKIQIAVSPLIDELRSELYPGGYANADFRSSRSLLRPEDLYQRPTLRYRTLCRLAAMYEHWHLPSLRRRALSRLIEHIRYDLRTTTHTAISPVSGLIDIVALHSHDPADTDLQEAFRRLEMWMWQDDRKGLRIAGARSGTWDSAFALQALAVAGQHVDVAPTLRRGRAFLASQQIRAPFALHAQFDRSDPRGGFCLAGLWHGWPVSDCTGEALLGVLQDEATPAADIEAGVCFILRCQNSDGGFGTYERRKTVSTLEWLNPAEMFADSMTEHSFTECTASCVTALAAARRRLPAMAPRAINAAIRRGAAWIAGQQLPDGSWSGFWGVHFIYGTLFGIRGLAAGGEARHAVSIERACAWLLGKQKADGGWGEHYRGCLEGRYVDHPHSQAIQTAWALIGLIEAGVPAAGAIERGARCLAALQCDNGEWPEQDHVGVFFRTALIQFTLYRCYFPVWALGLYATRCAEVLAPRLGSASALQRPLPEG